MFIDLTGTPSKFATITPVETDSATAAAVETDDSFNSSMDISNSSSTSDLSELDELFIASRPCTCRGVSTK